MGWPTSSDGRMRGTPERTESLNYDRLIDFQQRRLGVALIQLEVANDSSPGSDLDRTSAMMETRLRNINHLTSSSNRRSQEILLLK